MRVIVVRSGRFAGWPLFENGRSISPDELGFPDEFMFALLRWHAYELRNNTLEGWSTPAREAMHWLKGNQLIEALHRRLGGDVDVIDDRPPLSRAASAILHQ